MLKQVRFVVAAGAMLVAANASAAVLEDLLAAADNGQCIEAAAAEMISAPGGAEKAGEIVSAALQAATMREAEQRALGCKGDIAAQAIAAGANPDDVLGATAAGIPGGGGNPGNLGGIGGGNAGGGAGTASAS
jgi:hypothetical protein